VARRSGTLVRVGVVAVVAAMGACIIPDGDLDVRGDAVNPGTVRFVEAIAMTPAAHLACRVASRGELSSCPLVPATLPFGAIDPAEPLCVCPGGRDDNALSYLDVYVEDPDLDQDGRPKDAIYGALLLDLPAASVDPRPYVAYANLLPPTVPAANVNLGFNSYSDAIERPEPLVRRLTIGDSDTRVDLCNDNPAAPDGNLEPGLHSLRLIVTDRPWYREVLLDDGEPVFDDADELVRVPVEEASIGVPDLPAGATYAIADYVFRCEQDDDDPETPETCECVEAM
jgi:hypothetical protein